MTHKDDGGGVYTPHWTASQGPSEANAALTNQQIEAIFGPNSKSSPIEDYIGQITKLAQNWHDNTGILKQTVSDAGHPTSMAGLMKANTGDLKWTGTAASDYGTKAKATAAYGDEIAKVMPQVHTVLSQLATDLGTSRRQFQPIFEAWGTPDSGSPAKVPNAMVDLIVGHLWHTIIEYPVDTDITNTDPKYYYDSHSSGPMTINATTYVPKVNMHADPGNPYLASTFTLYAKGDGGDYGYSGLVWCSYNRMGGVSIEKVTVYDSANGNNSMDGTTGFEFTPKAFQQHFWQQYNTHLLDLMTTTGQHFATARSHFPAIPQPAPALKPPTGNGTGPTGMSPTGGSPSGLNPGKIGSPGAPGLKHPTMPKAPSGLPTPKPPPYHLPTPTPPPKGLPGPGAGGLPGGPGGLPGGGTGLPNPPGSVGGGFPTPTGLVNTGPGTPGYTSTQTAGFNPNQLPTLASGLPTGGLGGGLGPGGTAAGLAGLSGGLGGLGATPGALGGFGGGAANAGSSGLSLGTTASGAPLAAGETAAAQGALGEQAAMAEAGAAGRMPMMPPMAPMGMNNGNGDRNRKSWLPEEEDLWGLAEGSAAPPVIGSDL